MRVHLIDGTFELFRAFFGAPSRKSPSGVEVGATRGLLRSLLGLVQYDEMTHAGVAFDTVIESFRNELYEGYKSGEGIEPELLEQFPLAEEGARALGFVVWSMVEFEADDAIATASARLEDHPEVEQVIICSPDKDLTQCVRGARVVCEDRIRKKTLDEEGVVEKYGVPPVSIPDWLALVGDSADGFPGIPRWGAKSSATVLARYGSVAEIPDDVEAWDVKVRGAAGLAQNLRERRDEANLYRKLATLRTDVPITEDLEGLRWPGANRPELEAFCDRIGDDTLLERVPRWQ